MELFVILATFEPIFIRTHQDNIMVNTRGSCNFYKIC